MKLFLRWMAVMAFFGCAAVVSASCLTLCPIGEKPATLATHECFGLCLGARTCDKETVSYHGLTLGLAHASMPPQDVMRFFQEERCNFNGASIQLLSQLNIGTIRGVSLTGLIALQDKVQGVQLSGLANEADIVQGVQTALVVNLARETRGVQVGLLNLSKDLKGVQFGLLNINRNGWILPLINIGW